MSSTRHRLWTSLISAALSLLCSRELPAQTTARAASQPASAPGSASGGYSIRIVPDHADGLYKLGEEATFAIHLLKDEARLQTSVEARLLVNDSNSTPLGQAVEGNASLLGEVPACNSGVRYKATAPCCAIVRVEYKVGEKGVIFAEAGIVCEPNQIGLSMPCPDDFDGFWAAQKKTLAAAPMNARLTPIEGNGVPPSVEAFDLKADCPGWAPVSAYFARPKGAKPKSLPAILTVQGAGVHSSSLLGPVGQAGQGRLAMDMNAHGIENGRPEKFYTDLLNGDLRDYARRGLLTRTREDCYFLGMYLRLARAMEFLCSQPEWDGKNLFVSGSSQGGAQAIVAAGLDPRVNLFSASLPALCDLTGMQANRSAGWPLNKTALDANQVRTVRYYDACNFAARTKATAVVRVGLIDHTCPPAGVFAMCNQLKGTKYVYTYPDAGHAYSPPETYKASNEKFRDLMTEAAKR